MQIAKTLSNQTEIQGIGIHSGVNSKLIFKPANAGSGIQIKHHDFSKSIQINPQSIGSIKRATSIGSTNEWIYTPEHLLSACSGVGITDLLIEMIGGNEIPIMDGSAKSFTDAFLQVGLKELDCQYD